MARTGRFDHLKPEILRLIAEGMSYGQILKAHPEIPKATLYRWYSSVPNYSEPVPNSPPSDSPPADPPIRLRLPIDPESPLEKIRNALWDVVYEPEGKGAAVQALNLLIRLLNVEYVETTDLSSLSEEDLARMLKRE